MLPTEEYLWDPPCYLEVTEFSKVEQVDSLDQLRTSLEYNIFLAQHGDNACRSSSADFSIVDSAGKQTFKTLIDGDDLVNALSSTGFSLAV